MPCEPSFNRYQARRLAGATWRGITPTVRTAISMNKSLTQYLSHVACANSLNVSLSFGGGQDWAISEADMKLNRMSDGRCVAALFELHTGTSAPSWIIGDTFLVSVFLILSGVENRPLNRHCFSEKCVFCVPIHASECWVRAFIGVCVGNEWSQRAPSHANGGVVCCYCVSERRWDEEGEE